MKVLNMGAGVQTAYLLYKHWKEFKAIIFADPQDEHEETYRYIEDYLKPFAKSKGIPWYTVKAKRKGAENGLMAFCLIKKIFPIAARRWCTQDFKVKPIQRKLRELGATRKNPIISIIGISWDESQRANFTNDVQYQKKEYPLVDLKITRKMCKEGIIKEGFPVPPKSGCKHCMMQKRNNFRVMAIDNREYFDKVMYMEENAFDFPKHYLKGKYPLRMIVENATLESFMPEEEESGCDSGYCFT